MQTGAIESCIASVGASLNVAKTSKQQYFVDAVYRCQGTTMCDWVNCAHSNNDTGYAGAHLPQITYDCQQQAMCRLSSGQTVSDGSVNQCIQTTGNSLNANPANQAAYDARYTRCAQQVGCSWGACQ